MLRHISRSDQLAHRIHTDVLLVLPIVRTAHDLLHFLLPFMLPQGFFLHQRDQRKGAVGGLCFHDIHTHQLLFFIIFQNLVPDADRLVSEINRRPLQPQHFASTQTVVRRKQNRHPDGIAVETVDELLDFLRVVVAADELHRLRSVRLLHGIGRNDPALHR